MLGRFADIREEKIYDLVIVGGGPAGLTLARSTAKAGLSVALLEAGGEKRTKQSQDFYRGEVGNTAHPWPEFYRVRAIGGSSTIWGGRCIPFDPIDFETRPWVPRSGWPVGHAQLAPYYAEALELAEAGRSAFDPASALPGEALELARGLDGDLVRTTIERFSKPTDFWRRYGAELTAMPGVDVFLEAPAIGVRLRSDGRTVDAIEVSAPDRTTKRVSGSAYILALGGFETTRLLLASNDVRPRGVGNDHGQLGRHYMAHLGTTAGTVTFSGRPDDVAFDYSRDAEGIYVRRRLWLTEKAQREFGLLNTTFRTHLPEPANPAHGDAILSAMFLVKDLVLYEYSRKFVENPVTWGARVRHVGNIVRQPVRLADFGMRWLKNRTFADRKLPSVVLKSKLNRYELEFHAEQAPNPDSRLTLSTERDALGMPRLKVDWRITDLDRTSLLKSYTILAEELRRTGAGRLDYDPDELVERAQKHGVIGGHHIGTTRMSAAPQGGVVDPSCRVHGVDNLYIASASVFPTSGQANPTLTILALTLRLADHLIGQLHARRAA